MADVTGSEQQVEPQITRRSLWSKLIEIAIWVFAPAAVMATGFLLAIILGAPPWRVIVVTALVALGAGGYFLYRPNAKLSVQRARAAGLVYVGLMAAIFQIPQSPPRHDPPVAQVTDAAEPALAPAQDPVTAPNPVRGETTTEPVPSATHQPRETAVQRRLVGSYCMREGTERVSIRIFEEPSGQYTLGLSNSAGVESADTLEVRQLPGIGLVYVLSTGDSMHPLNDGRLMMIYPSGRHDEAYHVASRAQCFGR